MGIAKVLKGKKIRKNTKIDPSPISQIFAVINILKAQNISDNWYWCVVESHYHFKTKILHHYHTKVTALNKDVGKCQRDSAFLCKSKLKGKGVKSIQLIWIFLESDENFHNEHRKLATLFSSPQRPVNISSHRMYTINPQTLHPPKTETHTLPA